MVDRQAMPPHAESDVAFVQRVVRRHRRLILAIVGGMVLLAGTVTLLQEPTYTASTLLLIEPSDARPEALDVGKLARAAPRAEADYFKTQHEILSSKSVATDVIESLDLGFKQLELQSPGERLSALLADESRPASETRAAEDRKNPVSSDRMRGLVGLYERGLEIRPIEKTGLVYVRFTSADSELSAQVANAHAASYIALGAERYAQATEGARQFLEETLGDLRENIGEAESALDSYRSQERLISVEGPENLEMRRLDDLSRRWTEAEALRIEIENQIALIQRGQYDLIPEALEGAGLESLRRELAEAEAEYREAATLYRSPALIEDSKLRVEAVRARLQAEVQQLMAGLQAQYEVAQEREAAARQRLAAQKNEALRQKRLGAQYSILENEVAANRRVYETVLERFREMELASQARASNAFVIDAATPPGRPSSPDPLVNLALALVVGLVLSAGTVATIELLSSKLRGPEDLEALGLPLLGVVPDMRKLAAPKGVVRGLPQLLKPGPVSPGTLARLGQNGASNGGAGTKVPAKPMDERWAVALDAYRTIRTNVLLSQAGEPPRIVLFTSAGPAEGKTATTLNTAVMFAQTGASVVVVDADLRGPSCHEVLHMEAEPGLTDVLTGAVELEEALRTTNSSLSVLPSGRIPPNPAELLGSATMQDLLHKLAAQYDYVLVDSAPIVAVPDTVPLAAIVDGVILVVDQGSKASRNQTRHALSRLHYARAPVLGAVINRVDARDIAHAGYGYGYAETA